MTFSLEYLFTRISAALNNKIDLYRMGTFYYEGKYVSQDFEKAKAYLQKAANKKYYKALFYLGLIELKTEKQLIDLSLALRYFLLSRQESPEALQQIHELEERILALPASTAQQELLFKVGYMYANDVVVGLNVPKALQFYELAANEGHSYAKTELAKLLMQSRPGVTKNIPRAYALLKEAAEADFTPAQIQLQKLYERYPEYQPAKSGKHCENPAEEV